MRRALAIGTLAAVLAAGSAAAAPPARERIEVGSTFEDAFLTEACGIAVTTTERGHITIRTYDGGRKVELVTLSVRLTATSAEGSFRFRNVGADVVRRDASGRLIGQTSGQTAFTRTGVIRRDAETGEVIKEAGRSLAGQLAAACAALNPA